MMHSNDTTNPFENLRLELRRGCLDCLADYRLLNTRTPLEEALHLKVSRV